LGESVSLEQVVEKCPLRLTGADFYALCSDALLTAITDRIEFLEELSKTDPEKVPSMSNSPIQVEQQHFLRALERLTPSVSEEELKHYKRLQAQFNSTKKET
jgi:peroxin-6